ncbi:Cytochrome b5 heme-binding domain-containing protein [Meloidogyne graminicola]|uniref:Cytochrome b5 heme-binding domain-containing protein n=1 Tax=Meloidogyne graminicola TaxID=189291 RepID=A0A8S9ZWR8_9BILA|nr:Cytochrome b5 heme-binding domain-containing protein [Meloidogyne graminicola]
MKTLRVFTLLIFIFICLLAIFVLNAHSADKKIIVRYGNKTFDITSFVPHHPGGPLVLKHANGLDVTDYLAGLKSINLPEEGNRKVHHHHGPGAFHVLQSLEIKIKFKLNIFLIK